MHAPLWKEGDFSGLEVGVFLLAGFEGGSRHLSHCFFRNQRLGFAAGIRKETLQTGQPLHVPLNTIQSNSSACKTQTPD